MVQVQEVVLLYMLTEKYLNKISIFEKKNASYYKNIDFYNKMYNKEFILKFAQNIEQLLIPLIMATKSWEEKLLFQKIILTSLEKYYQNDNNLPKVVFHIIFTYMVVFIENYKGIGVYERLDLVILLKKIDQKYPLNYYIYIKSKKII